MAIEQEAREGLQGYRDSLASLCADNPGLLEHGVMKDSVEKLVSRSTAAIAVIPYDTPTLSQALELSQNSWHEPYTKDKLLDAKNRVDRIENGEDYKKIFRPAPFYSTILDLMVIFDDSAYSPQEYGEIYTTADFISSVAHEYTHASIFSKLGAVTFGPGTSGDRVAITTSNWGRQERRFELTKSGDSDKQTSAAYWLEEAFADYIAKEARAEIFPGSIPKSNLGMEFPECRLDGIIVPKEYLSIIGDDPDSFYTLGIPVAAIGLENLDRKRPGLIRKFTEAIRLGNSEGFIDYLKNQLGEELTSKITTHQEYNTWGDIYRQIEEL